MQKALSPFFKVSLYTFGYLLIRSDITLAQVTPDNTVNTQVNQNGGVAEITGGETRGENLFHSFQDFSVPTGNEASFNNATDISNIFSRVTGGNISNIDGLIRANGSASLFLINPAGIIFGQNARLDIGGSFYGSTASSILFEDGEFSAADLDNPPLLTVNAPIGLGFRDNPGDIENNSVANDGNGLEVATGNNVSLLGGDISFNGGNITAPGGRIELGGLSEAGTINIAEDSSLSFPDNVAKADVLLSNNAVVNVTSGGNGLISVNANNLELTGESLFKAEIGEGLGSQNAVAGNINIIANSLSLNNNARLSTRNEGQGNAGNITLTIADSIVISDGANINTQISEKGTGTGNAGNVSITTNTLELLGGANISVNNIKPVNSGNIGNSGDISIQAEESVFINNSILSATIFEGITGDAGSIEINSPQVSLTNNAVISVSNSGNGKIGNINVDSPEISVDNFSLITASSRSDSGNNNEGAGSITFDSEQVTLSNGGIIDVTTANQTDGGQITINSEVLEIFSGGVLQTATEGDGNAGSITLNISDRILIDGDNAPSRPSEFDFNDDILNSREETTGIFANAQLSSMINADIGNGGEISITSNSFKLDNNAQLLARYTGRGNEKNGGTITLNIADSLVIDNQANINVEVPVDAIGNAGTINITANTFELLGQSSSTRTTVIAPNDGQGNSGSINITAHESVLLSSSIISSTITDNAEGNSGNIRIESPQVSLKNNAIISVSSQGNGLGGEINIDSEVISIDNFSLIAASSRTNDSSGSGNINLNGNLITLSNGGVINATTASDDNAGEININAEILEIFSGGVLQTATEGNGRAGNIILNISDRIVLDGNDAPLQPEEFKMPDENGVPNVFFDSILNNLEGKTGIFAGTNEDAPSQGGNIDIDTKFIVAFPNGNSDILANSQQGQGGNITINAESLFGIDEGEAFADNGTNDIDASSQFSLDGNVMINTPDTNPIQGTTELPTNVVVPEQTTAQACQANREIAANNSLMIVGKGGVPPSPELVLDSENIYINGEDVNSAIATPQPIKTSQGRIQPARGIKVKPDGGIVLTAYRTNNSGERIAASEINCDRKIDLLHE